MASDRIDLGRGFTVPDSPALDRQPVVISVDNEAIRILAGAVGRLPAFEMISTWTHMKSAPIATPTSDGVVLTLGSKRFVLVERNLTSVGEALRPHLPLVGTGLVAIDSSTPPPSTAILGPGGYTLTDPVRAILEPLCGEERGGLRHWEGLAADGAAKLVALLPEAAARNRHQEAPSLADAAELIARRGGSLAGYWVLPPREDERISLTEVTVPKRAAGELTAIAGQADERANLGRNVRLWWD